MKQRELRERAAELPAEPGVYQFLEDNTVRYVGKALELRDRVRSYADPRSERIRQMVARADDIDIALTETETQALLLEANLIKRHQPRYNVRLKDDKSYPLVQFTNHSVPRIEVTRDPDSDATVFGPYTEVKRLETAVKALREVYGLRGCSDHKYNNRNRPCLEYEVGLCSAPCTGEIDATAYRSAVESAVQFFEGKTGILADPLRQEMQAAATAEEFERAANIRDRLAVIESFHGGGEAAVSSEDNSHTAETTSERAVDVLGVAIEGTTATVARLHSDNGQLVDRSQHRLNAPTGEDRASAVLTAFLTQYYAERSLPDAILCSEHPHDNDVREWLSVEGVNIRVPGTGRESKLIDLALKNARNGSVHDNESAALADALGFSIINRIEGFDVSHSQGRAVVGSNVCFIDGSAATDAYRRKRLTDTNDDYARMQELLTWRAKRACDGRDERPDPDLIVIDGGKGQLRAAREAVETTGWDVSTIALAKADELVVTPNGVHDWDADAPQLHLLQRVRDEAHRFAVQYHQSIRDDIHTVLSDVPGVGEQTQQALLRRFGSVENVRSASRDALCDVPGVGKQTADTIANRL
ncbi:excinuclease ABC subunit C [Haloquadratum walsbyi]|mgnify:FL=1|jgi:excinuclease ABC subunit C|uniref:UvrABC system protein C n=1 Tax=Haloquadratum walsbyi (strain DSM 16790 / HBSQ001) TaxID=362976 RepID=UVRC_HALWD|nr:excinuclease ABC subunit C [Haloquadratum walsbyi]Q18E52.1 RecName: Full=UvrABC system protein C; Short=Protein UvrC; AltName: Full=Excinuclease ABC subunit C [Haloquadratum walsbyi DSM 16790]CAJ53781.1 UvrABC system protein C [Haloquadratum walsbyi DSM 16790]